MQDVVSPTPYWPFDGSNQDPAHLPQMSTANIAPAQQPLMYPSQAFFMGRCAKSMHLNISTLFEAVDPNSNITFGMINIQNLVRRISIPGSFVCPIKFEAQAGATGTTLFKMDFSIGVFGLGTFFGSNKVYGYMPSTTLRAANGNGAIEQTTANRADGSITFAAFPSFHEGAIVGIGFYGLGSTPDFQISSVTVLQAELRLTERIDYIFFANPADLSDTGGGSSRGQEIAIVCPELDINRNSDSYRTGFRDVTKVWVPGVVAPLTKGVSPTQTTFTVTSRNTSGVSAVGDVIRFVVPNTAVTGPISFTAVYNPTNEANTSDYYSTPTPLNILG